MASQITATDANLATYICSGLAAVILIARLVACRLNPRPFDASFFITLLALLLVVSRVVLTYFVLQYGTTSDYLTTSIASPDTLTEAQLHDLRLGSILSLLLRLVLTSILWLLNLLLLLLYSRFISHLPWMRLAIRLLLTFLALSYTAVLLTTFLECRPFQLIYQLTPPPGSCVKAYAQISLQCACNAIIDAALMLISLPIIFIRTSPGNQTRHRARMALLISLGLFCITITGLRWGYTFRAKSFQPARTFWASINVLVAAFVANAPVLYGTLRLLISGRKVRGTKDSLYAHTHTGTGTHGPGPAQKVTTMIEALGGRRRAADAEDEVGIVKETSYTIAHDVDDPTVGVAVPMPSPTADPARTKPQRVKMEARADTEQAKIEEAEREAEGERLEKEAKAEGKSGKVDGVEDEVDRELSGIEHVPATKPA